MSKTCQEVIERMNLYLDGRLSGGQYQELAKHLEQCEHCRKRMNYLRVISSEIRADRPAMPDHLHSNIMQYIAKANEPAPARKLPLKRWAKSLAICAAALALLFAVPAVWKTVAQPQAGTSDLSTAKTENWMEQLLNKWKSMFSKEDATDDDSSDASPDDVIGNPDQDVDQTGTSGQGSVADSRYTLSVMHSKERFARYIVVTGPALDVSAFFDMKNVTVYPEDGSIYVHLLNNASSSAQVYNCIRQMNLTLHTDPEGLPDVDANAPEILLIILPK